MASAFLVSFEKIQEENKSINLYLYELENRNKKFIVHIFLVFNWK